MPQDALPPERPVADAKSQPVPKWRKRLWWINKFLVFPLIAMVISALILSRIGEWWTGPEVYRVFVVGNFTGQDQNSYLIWKGISDTYTNKAIDGIPVRPERVNDMGDPYIAKKLSIELANRVDTLMVIGHMSSSQSLKALPAYLLAEPPVPVILPVETNPNLIPQQFFQGFMKNRLYNPIFLIAPNDKVQAKTAAEFMIREGKNVSACWVIMDDENSTYSKYLTNEFVIAIQKKKQVVILRSSITTLPSLDMLKKFGIDCIYFVGRWYNALALLEQVHSLWSESTPPMVILSDSVVDNEFLKHIKADLSNVYVMYPMSAEQYQKKGHYGLGRDLGRILEALIDDINLHFSEAMKEYNSWSYWLKWIFNKHQVSDARHVLRLVMGNAVSPPYRHFSGDDLDGEDEYVFSNDGRRKNARFHIWELTKDKEKNSYIFKEFDFEDLNMGENNP